MWLILSRLAAATVERLEYDPNRTAFIELVKYQDGELAYIIAPQDDLNGNTRALRPLRRELRALFKKHSAGLKIPKLT